MHTPVVVVALQADHRRGIQLHALLCQRLSQGQLQQQWIHTTVVARVQATVPGRRPDRCQVGAGDHLQAQVNSLGGQRVHPLSRSFVLGDLQQAQMEPEVRLVSLQRFDPLRPELHAPAAQPPAPPAAAAKHVAHQHPEGCRCSTQIVC